MTCACAATHEALPAAGAEALAAGDAVAARHHDGLRAGAAGVLATTLRAAVSIQIARGDVRGIRAA